MARMSAAERRAHVVDAAIAVVAEEGLTAASTRRIAERAGVHQGIVHYVFTDKDDLLKAVVERLVETMEQLSLTALDDAPTLIEAIRRATELFWRVTEADPGLQLAQYELTAWALRSGRADLAEWQYDRYRAVIRSALASAAGDQTLPVPLEDLADLLLSTVDGVLLGSLVRRDPAASRREMDLLLTALEALLTTDLAAAGRRQGTHPTPSASG